MAKSESGGFVNAPYLDMTVPYAAGALYSTVQDLYRWDRALYGDAILSNETKARMFAPHIAILGQDGKVRAHYGYGWIIAERQVGNDHRPVRTLEHFGGINGFMSAIVRFPESGHLIVLLNNTDTVQLGTILEEIIGILYTRN